jgi:hypothetical protein
VRACAIPPKDGIKRLRSRKADSVVMVAHADRRRKSSGLKAGLSESLVNDMVRSLMLTCCGEI